jgi:hypothetical protein
VASGQLGCYVHNDTEAGLVGYGCDVFTAGAVTTMTPVDPYHRQLYIGPLGLYLKLRSAAFGNMTLDLSNPASPQLTVNFDHAFAASWDAAGPVTANLGACPGIYAATRLEVDVPTHPQYTKITNVVFTSPSNPTLVRGAYELPCDAASATLTWTWA